MNIPTYCTNCDTTEGVRFVCRTCKFARFCSKDCQKKCWKKHKRYCMPLNDAVNDTIEKARPLLRDKYRIDDQDLHCMFCLEGGTSEDPLFHSGCGCRPDSGMSIGHIKCFQEFARVSFADEKKQDDAVDCGVVKCLHCSQGRYGILKFEMYLVLSKLYDPDCLTRQIVQGVNNKRIFAIRTSLLCLDLALQEAIISPEYMDFHLYCRLRTILLRKNVRKHFQYKTNEFRIYEEIDEDDFIGQILIDTKKYQVAIHFNKRNYEMHLLNINRYPLLKHLSSSVVCNYAQSLHEAFEASSQKSNVDDDPPYHYLEEAERLMREELRDNSINHVVYMNNTRLLCSILMTQEKFAEAKQIASLPAKDAACFWTLASFYEGFT